MTDTTRARAKTLAVEMTRWKSVSGSDGEAAFAGRLHALLAESPAFRDNPETLFTRETHGDPPRSNLFALARGTGRKCLVLAGHFDTVSTANYGALEHLATEPEALTAALIAELSARARTPAEAGILDDLTSGRFLAGRGLLDMKSGLAAGIVALERFASLDAPAGNLLFVATPDEENRSRGMRALRAQLVEIARDFDLDIVGGINLDSTSDAADGEGGRAVYLGSVGKTSPFAFVVGRPTHAGYAFDGVSAHRISAEILRAMETNSDLCDEAHGELSPAPVCLAARDVRHGYEVTTPAHVSLSFNWLTHRRTVASLFTEFGAIVEGAMQTALNAQAAHARRFLDRQGLPHDVILAGEVIPYADLKARAIRRGGASALSRVADVERAMAKTDDPVSAARAVVGAMITEAGLEGPAVVTGFSTLHYPRVHLDAAGEAGRRFAQTVIASARGIAARHATTIVEKQFFAGISDMSFLGHIGAATDTKTLAENTPCADAIDTPGADAIDTPGAALAFPVVNIGPWGRDYHQKWERVHVGYAFDVLPEILFDAVVACLRADSIESLSGSF